MPSPLKSHHIHFLKYLMSLNPDMHRQELAVLRRGLTLPPGEDPNMYRIIAHFVPDEDRGTEREKLYYMLASLFAFHPMQTENGNFGNHMAQAATQMKDDASTERRFTVLLNAHRQDLPDYLRQAVSFLKSKEVPVNWLRLFEDLLLWDHPQKIAQRNWANGFWVFRPVENHENN